MYWWNIGALRRRLGQGPLSQAEWLSYLLAHAILAGVLASPEALYNRWDVIAQVATTVIGVVGLVVCFRRNGGSDGQAFADRFFAISWVVTVRLVPGVGVAVFAVLGLMDWLGLLTGATNGYDTVGIVAVECLYWWRVAVHVGAVAQAGRTGATASAAAESQQADGGLHPARTGRALDATGWFSLACSIVLCLMAWGGLGWLLWSYVPARVSVFAGMGVSLPMTARLAIVLSHWFIRYLPFAIVGTMLVGPVLLAMVLVLLSRLLLGAWLGVARWLTATGLALSVVAAGACAFVVASIESAYATATAPTSMPQVKPPFGDAAREAPAQSTPKMVLSYHPDAKRPYDPKAPVWSGEPPCGGYPAQGSGTLRVGSDSRITPPRLKRKTRGDLSRLTSATRLFSTFLAEITVSAAGRVSEVRVLRSVSEEFDQLMLGELESAVYEPATLDGVAVPACIALTARPHP